jgi:thiol:disulfide interchange protein DsbD
MKKLFLVAFAVLFSAFAETAVEPKAYVSIGKIKAVSLKVGKEGELVIPAAVLKGHHIQANPATLPNLIPTELSLETLEGIEVKPTVYPKSKPWRLASAGKEIQTFDGKVEFKVGVVAKNVKPGKYELKGSLRYQACDEKNCFFPSTVPVTVPLTVTE